MVLNLFYNSRSELVIHLKFLNYYESKPLNYFNWIYILVDSFEECKYNYLTIVTLNVRF